MEHGRYIQTVVSSGLGRIYGNQSNGTGDKSMLPTMKLRYKHSALLDLVNSNKTPVMLLHEIVGPSSVEFIVLDNFGVSHAPVFVTLCRLTVSAGGLHEGVGFKGEGASKQKSKHAAAQLMLRALLRGQGIEYTTEPSTSQAPPVPAEEEEVVDVAEAMGFSDFGTSEKCRIFDIKKVMQESKEIKFQLASSIPASYELVLRHGAEPITALAVDPHGSRLVSASYEFDMKFWDFADLDYNCTSSKTLRPCKSHKMKHIEFSPSGDKLLIIAGKQAQVMSRDGVLDAECTQSYANLSNLATATGHSDTLNWGCWHPNNGTEFITCGKDCCVRMWDSTQVEVFLAERQLGKKAQKAVIVTRDSQQRKTIPTTCAYSRDAGLLAAGCKDGSIQMWDARRTLADVALMCRSAHAQDSHICSLSFSYDNKMLASRGMDDSMKLWDMRKLSHSVHTITGLDTIYERTDCTFSPDDRIVVTSFRTSGGSGLNFYNRDTAELVNELTDTVDKGTIIRTIWHPTLNQLVVGNSEGKVIVYYDMEQSHKGAKLCLLKTKRRATLVSDTPSQTDPTDKEESERRGKRRPKSLEVNETEPPADRGETLRDMFPLTHDYPRMREDSWEEERRERYRDEDRRGTRHSRDAQETYRTREYPRTQPRPDYRYPEEDTAEEDYYQRAWKKQRYS